MRHDGNATRRQGTAVGLEHRRADVTSALSKSAGPAEPLVSVLTPSFNQARWLVDNLASVAAQTYGRIEHVVQDGGSTDGSVDILRSAGTSVLWESARDAGQSDAINRAFKRSTGDIVGWLNSDDAYFSRDAVAEAVDIFNRYPDVGMVYGHAALVNASGTVLYVLWSPPRAESIIRLYNVIYQPAVFIRRAVIARPWFVDPACDYMMDRELWLHLAGTTQFHRMNRIVAVDRHQLARKSYTHLDAARRDFRMLRERYKLPRVTGNRLWQRLAKIALRTVGLVKLKELRRGSDSIDLTVPAAALLVVRQVAQLRRWMPPGE